jgi:hypothetical protein
MSDHIRAMIDDFRELLREGICPSHDVPMVPTYSNGTYADSTAGKSPSRLFEPLRREYVIDPMFDFTAIDHSNCHIRFQGGANVARRWVIVRQAPAFQPHEAIRRNR